MKRYMVANALMCLLCSNLFGGEIVNPITFTTGTGDPANGLINAVTTPATFVNLGGLGFDLRIDAGETQNLAPLGDVHLLNSTVSLVNFSFFATGTLNPISVKGVTFRIEDVETIGEALTGFSYTDINGAVQNPLFSDDSIFTPDSGTIIDLEGSRFYHSVGVSGIQLGKGIGIDLSSTPLQSFSIHKNSVVNTGGVTIGPTLGSITPIPEPSSIAMIGLMGGCAIVIRRWFII